jgi:hypothetical protein
VQLCGGLEWALSFRPVALLRVASAGIATLALGALGCAGPPPEGVVTSPQPIGGQFAGVEVSFAALEGVGAGFDLEPADADQLRATVRQSALDWLENANRLSDHGSLDLYVALDSLRLRSATVTWLLAWAAPPDHLAAEVQVARAGVAVARYRVRVESGLDGYSWRDPAARLDRLARRLGRRLAEGL